MFTRPQAGTTALLAAGTVPLVQISLCGQQYSLNKITIMQIWCFPYCSVGKESTCNAEDLSSVPGLGRSPGGGNGNPFQYSRLEKPMDRGAWQSVVHGGHRVRPHRTQHICITQMLLFYTKCHWIIYNIHCITNCFVIRLVKMNPFGRILISTCQSQVQGWDGHGVSLLPWF